MVFYFVFFDFVVYILERCPLGDWVRVGMLGMVLFYGTVAFFQEVIELVDANVVLHLEKVDGLFHLVQNL